MRIYTNNIHMTFIDITKFKAEIRIADYAGNPTWGFLPFLHQHLIMFFPLFMSWNLPRLMLLPILRDEVSEATIHASCVRISETLTRAFGPRIILFHWMLSHVPCVVSLKISGFLAFCTSVPWDSWVVCFRNDTMKRASSFHLPGKTKCRGRWPMVFECCFFFRLLKLRCWWLALSHSKNWQFRRLWKGTNFWLLRMIAALTGLLPDSPSRLGKLPREVIMSSTLASNSDALESKIYAVLLPTLLYLVRLW